MDFKGKISTDTRRIGRGDVFFALTGERFDGHDFIGEAIGKGAAAIVYSDEAKAAPHRRQAVSWVRAGDTLRTYGDWAREFRRERGIRTVAVTGSSGKTTVKEMLAWVLAARFSVHKNQGTENNLIGVPKTIFALEPGHEILILELGTNLPGEIARLTEIAAPDTAVVTRVGPSHLQGLGSIEGVFAEKMSIARGLRAGGTLWVNGDDPLLGRARAENAVLRRVSLENASADLCASDIMPDGEGTAFRAGGFSFRLSCLGRHNVLNALLVLGIARDFGLGDAQIAERLASFRGVSGRLEIKKVEGLTFLDDSYNANPVSFEAALGTLAGYPAGGRKIVVAGDMLELGAESPAFHRTLGRRAAEQNFDYLITAGERSREAADEAVRSGFPASRVRACRDASEAGAALRGIAEAGDTVLVKGSRGMKMETVIACFLPSYTR